MMETEERDVQVYQLRLREPLEERFLASYCPPGTTLVQEGDTTLLSNIETDQSGIMGLIRHLHNLGCTILELQRL